MDAIHLQDRVNWGLNRAARVLGHSTDAYRPHGAFDPLDKSNRYLRLRAAFSRPDGNFHQAVAPGTAVWRGYFDAAYTRVGDYLVQNDDIWFIAAQQSLLPVLCVKTNKIVSVIRPPSPTTGVSYGGVSQASASPILSGWPASVLGINGGDKAGAGIPGDVTMPVSVVLLPASHGQSVRASDIVVDELGMSSMIVAAERSDLGWRLNTRQITT